MPWLGFLKFRASYGSVGNDQISSRRFPYLTLVSSSTVSPWGSNGVEGVSESTVGADNLKWEKAVKADFGIEGRLFKDKIKFVVDFFKDKRNGIFMQRVQVPDYAGLVSLPYGNVGKMVSYGADGNASYTYAINKDMNFTLPGKISRSPKMMLRTGRRPTPNIPTRKHRVIRTVPYAGIMPLAFSKTRTRWITARPSSERSAPVISNTGM